MSHEYCHYCTSQSFIKVIETCLMVALMEVLNISPYFSLHNKSYLVDYFKTFDALYFWHVQWCHLLLSELLKLFQHVFVIAV